MKVYNRYITLKLTLLRLALLKSTLLKLTFALIVSAAVMPSLLWAQGEMITITGERMVGSSVNGESVREVIGNVVLTQGNIRITCDHAVQYMARNDATLTGNVIVRQNNIIIEAPKGNYFGDERIAECHTGVKLNDGKIILTAINGNYYFNEQRAYFSENVKLYDTLSTMTSDRLVYYRPEDRAIATGNVSVTDAENTISADSLIHFRRERNSVADGNVSIYNKVNNTRIFGGHLENYSARKYTLITREPVLVQWDTAPGTQKSDTLVITSRQMESYNDSTQLFIATDSVKMVRGAFASENEYTEYYRNSGTIVTYKKNSALIQPVLWYASSQLTGDSLNIIMHQNRLHEVEAFRNSFILSRSELFPARFDQISGETVVMHFDSTGIRKTDVNGGVLSIYYTYDVQKPNGLTKSSSQNAVILFEDNAVSQVKLYGSPVSEYHPENLVKGDEQSFTLPAFTIRTGRPEKSKLLGKLSGKF